MSPRAQQKALLLEYDAALLHCLIEAIARDSNQSLPQTPILACFQDLRVGMFPPCSNSSIGIIIGGTIIPFFHC